MSTSIDENWPFSCASQKGEIRMPGLAKKKWVLVVDDEHIVADTLAKIFSNEGYETKAAYSAEEALAIVLEWRPHLVIVDVCLPGMSGIDLAILFKAEYPDCRITLFSGQNAASDFIETARQSGHSFDVLAKPLHPTELLSLASCLLSPSEGRA
jgi:CheY-like chemotaxis protein